jgi:hypothetical protein
MLRESPHGAAETARPSEPSSNTLLAALEELETQLAECSRTCEPQPYDTVLPTTAHRAHYSGRERAFDIL